METKNFEDLKLWQRAMDLVEEIYKISSLFPREETYGLTSQIRRAAISIPSNVAEGNIGRSKKDFNHFLVMAQGSLVEVKTQLLIAKRLKHITDVECINVLRVMEEVIKLLQGLRRFLKSVDV